MNEQQTVPSFPFARLAIPHPASSDRLTCFFRIFCAIPVAIILVLLVGFTSKNGHWAGPGILLLPTVLAILFRRKYPRWWFDWNVSLTKFSTRIGAYLLILRDEYPALAEDQSVNIELRYPTLRRNCRGGCRW